MQELFTRKTKKFIGVTALACFLATPVSCAININSAAAAAFDSKTAIEQRHDNDRNDRNDNFDRDKRPAISDNDRKDRDNRDDKNRPAPPRNDDRKDNDKKDTPPPPPQKPDNNNHDDKNPPPPPPRDDRHDKDNDGKDYDKGDIATAVLVGGVVGAVIAKNT